MGPRTLMMGAGAAVVVLVAVFVVVFGSQNDPTCGAPTPGRGGSAGQLASADVPAAAGAAGAEGLNTHQLANAAAVVAAGKGMGATPFDMVVALATAAHESMFQNYANDGSDPRLEPEQRGVSASLGLPHEAVGHDHGSVGQFQQQFPWWGTLAELMKPTVAAEKFYAKLLALPGRAGMSVTAVAQRIQASNTPAAYAAQEALARALYTQLAGTPASAPTVAVGAPWGRASPIPSCPTSPGGGGGPGPIGVVVNGVAVQLPTQAGVAGTLTFPDTASAKAAAMALSYLGTPYSWGGGNASGPTVGIHDGGVADSFGDYAKVGFDCSGLTERAYAAAGIEIGGDTGAQWERGGAGPHLPWSAALPGDLVFYGSPTHHVSLYLGQVGGRQLMVEAPVSGSVVMVSTVRTGDLVGVARPTAKRGATAA